MKYAKLACILLSTASISLAGCASDNESSAEWNTSVTTSSIPVISEKASTALSKVSASDHKKAKSDINNVHTIRILSTAANITVVGDPKLSQAQWELKDGKSSTMETTVSSTINDNTLTIQLNSKQKNALNTGPLPNLNVHVPIKDYDTLEISNEFGRISLESKSGLYPRNLVVSGSASDITSSNVIGTESSKLHTEFGKISYDLPKKLEALYVDLSTSMGSINNHVDLNEESESNQFVSKKVKGHVGSPKADSPTLQLSTQVGKIELNR